MLEIIKVPVAHILEADNSEHLFTQYSNEAKSDLVPKLKPDAVMYQQLEDVGMLDCLGVYYGSVLVGFLTMITSVMPHYTEKASTVESQFILKEYRKYGVGRKLSDRATDIAIDNGSVAMFMSAPIGSRLDRVAVSFGFKATNVSYTKKLSE